MENMQTIVDFLQNQPSQQEIIISFIVTFLLAFIMWVSYRFSHPNQEYSHKFAVTLVSLAVISTLLMDLIQTNLALSLGMLGSLSIVRFRTNIKDPRDIGFVFWAMAIGIASATESYVIALMGSVILSFVMIVTMKKQNAFHTMLLVIRGGQSDLDRLESVVGMYTRTKSVKAKNIISDSFEIVYEVEIEEVKENDIIDQVFGVGGVDSVNLLAQNNVM